MPAGGEGGAEGAVGFGLKKASGGASLVAQWLGARLPVRGHGFQPCSGKIPCAAEQLSLCAASTEPAL